MKTVSDGLEAPLRTSLQDELLCVADTKLVLGNWFAECVMNGRSLPDFAAILGMCTASYGQTRALYQYLSSLDHDYAYLERGRGPEDIRSMNLLDAPPENWEDFLCTIWLAEQAAWSMMSAFVHHPDRTVAGLARKVGEEAYFHFKYTRGWFRIIGGSDRERERFEQALAIRYPLAWQWFGPVEAPDPLHDAGLRDTSLAQVRAGFVRDAGAATADLAIERSEAPAVGFDDAWRPEARRNGPLPPGLFEVVRFKDAGLAR